MVAGNRMRLGLAIVFCLLTAAFASPAGGDVVWDEMTLGEKLEWIADGQEWQSEEAREFFVGGVETPDGESFCTELPDGRINDGGIGISGDGSSRNAYSHRPTFGKYDQYTTYYPGFFQYGRNGLLGDYTVVDAGNGEVRVTLDDGRSAQGWAVTILGDSVSPFSGLQRTLVVGEIVNCET